MNTFYAFDPFFFFFNDTATTEIYTLSLHDALPISCSLPIPNTAWMRGFRRSAETSTTDLPACANATARLAAVLVFPSPGRALVTRIVFAFDSLQTARKLVLKVRYASAASPRGSSTEAR